MLARFIGSMLMHINVEKDVRIGLMMMKYCLNHRDNFTNVYPAFFVGFMQFAISLTVEFNVMLILTSMNEILGVIMKFVSLASIANIPRFYYASLVNHKALSFGDLKLPITKYRKDRPLKGAPCIIHILRYFYKFFRIFFCSVSFYFMPFIAIIINFKFILKVFF
mgnify:CR=1 FL=1